MTREEAIKEINKVFEPAFANYIIIALTEGATPSDKALKQQPCEDWHGVPSNEMTLEQARQAVKDLRKMLPEYLEQNPYEDVVSRRAVLDALDSHKYSKEFCEEHHIDWSINLGMAHIAINDLPPVTPKEKTGKWINEKWHGLDLIGVTCNNCHVVESRFSAYCPNCGARMVSE